MLESAENAKRFAVAVEKAIADIKAKKLFRPYKNLQQFLMEECGWKSSRRAQQVIKFIEVKAALPPKSEPLVRTERVARALSSVPEAVTIIEIRPFKRLPGVQPVFLNQDQAIRLRGWRRVLSLKRDSDSQFERQRRTDDPFQRSG